ncbi:N-6 DNA methylase [Pillotina sp. SPG140]|jgi:predicted helicase
MNDPIGDYMSTINDVYHSGKGTEHSYRPAFTDLLVKLLPGLTIINEPKRIRCGAPDYIVSRGEIPVGYIETKDISVGIHSKAHTEQFDRYKKALSNLIITDYLTFELFVDGLQVVSVSIAQEKGGTIHADKKSYPAFAELIKTFVGFQGKTICQSKELAQMMAWKARLLAAVIEQVLNDKNAENDSLSDQLEAFRKILIHDLEPAAFADIYAQTLAYGLFAARMNDRSTETFNRGKAAALIPQSNPFLRRFFHYIAGLDLDDRIRWIVDALADIFNWVSVEELLKEFGRANQDPFIHFYETFLAEYDPKLRESRGVYYTPLPAVKFIVQAVDDILQKEFNLAKGLADNSKITRTIRQPDGTKRPVEFHKVQILDPAAGTGTFLAEVIEKIFSRFSRQKGLWAGYCAEHLIPRLNGFELLMAPYAMAHFKLEMMLAQTGYQATADNRIRVYLSNSLEEPESNVPVLLMEKWLSDEANEANGIKRDTPVMVVLGNPPYSGESANATKEEFLSAYKKEPGGIEKLKEKNAKWLNDDYVKFIRYGQNVIDTYGDGVLAFINNHSFLDNPTFRGMRWNLLQTFDKIYILDLHGNVKKKETAPDGSKDENVFDIQQGVSINLFIKTGKKKAAEVFHCDVYGRRAAKYHYLLEHTLASVPYQRIEPKAPHYFFVAKDFSREAEYEKGFGVQDMFPVNSVGVATARDDFTIHNTAQAVKDTISEFLKLDDETASQRFDLGKDVRDWSVAGARKDLIPNPDKDPNPDFSKIVKINYRPFDTRYTYYTGHSKGFHCMPRGNVMRHFIEGENRGLIIGRQGQVVGPMIWNLVFITSHITDLNLYYRGGGTVFPLYLYPEADSFDSAESHRPNLNDAIVNMIAKEIGLRFTPEKETTENTFAPIDILDYIYAVLHSPAYREKYREFLKIDFPRVPYPENAERFRALAALGANLRKAHLLENIDASGLLGAYPMEGSNTVGKPGYRDTKVWINKRQYFDEVPKDVWGFYIGGYQPAQKWLKDRKGRALNYDEIEHYQKILAALQLTIAIQAQVDTVIGE